MLRRTLIGALLLAITLGAWLFDSSRPDAPAWALASLGVVLTLGALRELLVMSGVPARQVHVGLVAGAFWVAVLVLAGLPPDLAPVDATSVLGPVGDVFTAASVGAAVYLALQIRHGPGPGVVRLVRSLWISVPWVGGIACLVALLMAGRLEYVIGVVLVAKSSDIGAYFGGKSFGRRKLAPTISGAKTWEGAVGGLILPSVVAAFLLEGVVLSEPAVAGDAIRTLPGGILGAALHGLVIAVLTIVSDLSESLVKRSCGVKDSSALFGEAGGFLDLADSLLLVGPIALAYTAVAA